APTCRSSCTDGTRGTRPATTSRSTRGCWTWTPASTSSSMPRASGLGCCSARSDGSPIHGRRPSRWLRRQVDSRNHGTVRLFRPSSYLRGTRPPMPDDQVQSNLKGMDDLDFDGWNNADWDGVFAHHHTDDVLVDWKGQAPTRGVQQHIDAMKAYVESAGGTPPRITAHPIAFGSGEWTCVVGEFEGGGRMVTVAKWRDGAIEEEYIWA